MAGQAVNLSGQINQLANSLMTPATLSQSQQGLLGNLQQAISPTPTFDVSTVEGLTEAVKESVRRGETEQAAMYAEQLKALQKERGTMARHQDDLAVANRRIDSAEDRQVAQQQFEFQMEELKQLNRIERDEITAEQKARQIELRGSIELNKVMLQHDNRMRQLDTTDGRKVAAAELKYERDMALLDKKLDAQWNRMEANHEAYTDRERMAHLNNMAEIKLRDQLKQAGQIKKEERAAFRDSLVADKDTLNMFANIIKASEDPAIKSYLGKGDRMWLVDVLTPGNSEERREKALATIATSAIMWKNTNGGTLEQAVAATMKRLSEAEAATGK